MCILLTSKQIMSKAISFQDFCKLESISFCMFQLRGNRLHNIISKRIMSTQKNYLYRLWNFHYWLVGQEFSYDFLIPIDKSTFQKQSKVITLEGLEHFLKIYENTTNSEQHFIRLITTYLRDPIHSGKKPNTLKLDYYVIKAYFERNDYPLDFRFNFKTRNNPSCDDKYERLLTLNGLLKILTIGQPTVMQKAVFLCKFHCGLDTSTFVDRFNFEAWNQITKVFGTDKYDIWDLELCPIPIKLTRIKTGIRHVGFLDIDAINALKCYLNYRQFKIGRKIQKNEPIFINHFNKPITEDWIRRSFRKLIRNAGLEYLVKDTSGMPKQFDFLRILLKSTLMACGTDRDVVNYSIGHKIRHYHQKNPLFTIEDMRLEYAKASKTINVFEKLHMILNQID